MWINSHLIQSDPNLEGYGGGGYGGGGGGYGGGGSSWGGGGGPGGYDAGGGGVNVNPQTGQAGGGGVSVNPQTGQADYSAQWAEYYRSMGMVKEAEAIEAARVSESDFVSHFDLLRS